MARKARSSIPDRTIPAANAAARTALEALVAAPTADLIDALLEACLSGVLVVDVSGSTPGSEPRIRTVLSTNGQLVLPLFTSTDEVRLAVPRAQHPRVQSLVLPGRDAFALITTADFIAVQLDPGSIAQVIARSFVEKALGTDPS